MEANRTSPILGNLFQQRSTGKSNRLNNNLESAHHEFMAEKFIAPLKDALKEWDNSTRPNEYYEDLAWGGVL